MEELTLTDMKRISISVPSSLDEKIMALRKTDRFVRCSYSEIVRQIIEKGFDGFEAAQSGTAHYPDPE